MALFEKSNCGPREEKRWVTDAEDRHERNVKALPTNMEVDAASVVSEETETEAPT
ncbi:MAG: hypothetical protein ACJAQT_002773 [Akkermansiaceae bacterium]